MYRVGVASLMGIHAMEASQCHYAMLAMFYSICISTYAWLPAAPEYFKVSSDFEKVKCSGTIHVSQKPPFYFPPRNWWNTASS
jgi:hypothetical protein